MAKLLMSRNEVTRAIDDRIRAGNDLVTRAEIAKTTGRYEDWFHIVAV